MGDDIAIKVGHVSKDFVLPHEKVTSIKSAFTSIYKRRGKSKETQHALRDVSFEVKKGEFFGIVGRNGSGKSTMLKILAGIYQPTKGSVTVRGKLVPFIELGVGFNPELTGRENVYLNGAMLGFSEKEVDAMYDDIVAFAELERFMDQKLKNYSSGMQVRLAFSMATRSDADILLIDEVLAVGDADFQRKCFDYFRKLKKDKKTVVFVSHDMEAVREYCDRAVLIEQSEVVLSGTSNKVANAYTQMFMEENTRAEQVDSNSLRWGDAKATYTNVTLSKRTLTDNDETIRIEAEVTAHESVEKPLFGFSVTGPTGVVILGVNNQIKQQPVGALKKSERLLLTWDIPNVFTEGKHMVSLALQYNSGTETADWWDEAEAFTVKRLEKTPYIISPEISLRMESGR